jgi:arylformamidase
MLSARYGLRQGLGAFYLTKEIRRALGNRIGMEAQARDRAYNARALVPDYQRFFDWYACESVGARAELEIVRDLAFGAGPDERLDLFPVAGGPLAVFFHGGWWKQFGKDDFSYVARGLVPHGVAVAVVNYGLAPEVPLRAIVAQARRALGWLRANGATYRYDVERIVAYGHSAGAHLAAMGAVAGPLHALYSLSGVFDLEPLRETYINEWLQLDAAEARALSPLALRPARPLPVDAIYGAGDPPGFADQSRTFVEGWRRLGCEGAVEVAPQDNHFSICARLIDPADVMNQRIAALAFG